jgi:hypothetical protein
MRLSANWWRQTEGRTRPQVVLLVFGYERIEIRRRPHHCAAEENRLRQGFGPPFPRSIRRRQIPQNSFSLATLRMKLAGLFRLLENGGHQVIRIPELPDPKIVETMKDACARRAPVGGQHRFPHRKHRD